MSAGLVHGTGGPASMTPTVLDVPSVTSANDRGNRGTSDRGAVGGAPIPGGGPAAGSCPGPGTAPGAAGADPPPRGPGGGPRPGPPPIGGGGPAPEPAGPLAP